EVQVPAHGVVELGPREGRQAVPISAADVRPGTILDLEVTADGQTTTISVPALDETLDYYEIEDPAAGRRPPDASRPPRSPSCGASPASAAGFELVAQPAHGDQALRVAGVVLDLRAQALDVHVEGLRVADVVGSPDPVDELAAGEDAIDVAQQHLEQLE